jgi:ammonia channel protein AmtB
VLSVLMQCLALTALMTVLWLVIGYSLAFDTTGMVEGQTNLNSFIGGFGRAFLIGVDSSTLSGSIPEILIGTVLAGVFGAVALGGNQEGLAIGSQVGVQLTAAVITAVWAGVASYALVKFVDAIVGLRVDQEDETSGLDLALHDERGYNL